MKTENATLWKAQEWDSDCECWSDMEHEGAQGSDRNEVEREARYVANHCAYRVRVRVVKAL